MNHFPGASPYAEVVEDCCTTRGVVWKRCGDCFGRGTGGFFLDERILCADGSTFCLRPWGECTCARIFKRVGEGVACWGGNAACCRGNAACCRGSSACLGGSAAKIFLLLVDLLVHLLLH